MLNQQAPPSAWKTKMFRNQSGQVGLNWIVGIGASLAIAFAGSLLTQSNVFNSKIDGVRTNIVENGNDISTLKAESEQYRRDITDINKKLDTILLKLR